LGVKNRLVLSDAAWERMAPLIIGRPDQKGSTGRDNRMFVETLRATDTTPRVFQMPYEAGEMLCFSVYDIDKRIFVWAGKSNPDATILSPDHTARIDFLLRYDDQYELVRDADLRSDVECCPRFRQIANNTTYRHIAEPDQTSVYNPVTLGLSRFRKVDDRHLGRPLIGPVRAQLTSVALRLH
jgi:hypothetical protein